MTPDRLAEIRQQAAKDAEIAERAPGTTTGPWTYSREEDDVFTITAQTHPDHPDHPVSFDVAECDLETTAHAIAHARTAIPRLVAAVKELAEEVERLNDKLEKWETEFSYLEPE